MNQPVLTSNEYNMGVVRQLTVMAIVWGIIGMLVGVILASQLAWPALNLDLPWTSFGRLALSMEVMNSIQLGETTFEQAIKNGDIKLKGDKKTFDDFLSLLDDFIFWFNIVTP